MYKIQSSHSANKGTVTKYSYAKELITKEILLGFAGEMLKNKCIEISEEEKNGTDVPYRCSTIVYSAEGYVMDRNEFLSVMKDIELIKDLLPRRCKHLADRLRNTLLNE